MTTRLGKLIQFPMKRRSVRGRLTATGEFLRLVPPVRAPRDGDDGPRAA
jgi:hypothetical protein